MRNTLHILFNETPREKLEKPHLLATRDDGTREIAALHEHLKSWNPGTIANEAWANFRMWSDIVSVTVVNGPYDGLTISRHAPTT